MMQVQSLIVPVENFNMPQKKLASADEYGSLANSLNRYIEVDVSLSNVDKRRE